MNLRLKPEVEQFIHDQVKAGHFTSPEEAVEAGVARLMSEPQRDRLDHQDVRDILKAREQVRRGETFTAAEVRSKLLGT